MTEVGHSGPLMVQILVLRVHRARKAVQAGALGSLCLSWGPSLYVTSSIESHLARLTWAGSPVVTDRAEGWLERVEIKAGAIHPVRLYRKVLLSFLLGGRVRDGQHS